MRCVAGLTKLQKSNEINGWDTKSALKSPAKSQGNPRECPTSRLKFGIHDAELLTPIPAPRSTLITTAVTFDSARQHVRPGAADRALRRRPRRGVGALCRRDDADDTEKRRYRAREPTLRSLVRLELASDSAEQMGKQLKRRFDRSYQRRGDNAAWRRANR